MAYESEIEKLQRRYDEKPEQWFAALADAYRKAGDVEIAVDVVKAGIKQRPNYVSGHIVLARCLVDLGEVPEAEKVFEQVLELDAENIIALRGLSEIAEGEGNIPSARRWMERLLEVDPMNEEVRESLTRLDALDTGEPPAAIEPQEQAVTPDDVATETVAPMGLEQTEPVAMAADEPPSGGVVGLDQGFGEQPAPAVETPEPPVQAPPEPPAPPVAESAAPPDLEPISLDPGPEPEPEPVMDAGPPTEPGPALDAMASPAESPPVAGGLGTEIVHEEPGAGMAGELRASEPAGDAGFVIKEDEPVNAGGLGAGDSGSIVGVGDVVVQPDSALEGPVDGDAMIELPNLARPGTGADDLVSGAVESVQPEGPAISGVAPIDFQQPPNEAQSTAPSEAPAETESGLAGVPPLSVDEPQLPTVADEPGQPDQPAGEAPAESWPEPVPGAPGFGETQSGDMQESWPEAVPGAPAFTQPAGAEPTEPVIDAAAVEAASDDVEDEPIIDWDALPPAEELSPEESAALAAGTEVPAEDQLTEPLPAMGAAAAAEPAAEPAVATPEPAPGQPVVTETMAEVLAQQGHFGQARAVYQQLVDAQPDSEPLRQRLAELEAEEAAMASQSPGGSGAAWSVERTGGTPLRAFLAGMLGRRPGAVSAAAAGGVTTSSAPAEPSPMEAAFEAPDETVPPGQPTRPAGDEPSLATVFGDDQPPPVQTPAPAAAEAEEPGAAAGMSYDKFFGEGEAEPEAAEEPEPKKDDDEDFKAWLNSLKS